MSKNLMTITLGDMQSLTVQLPMKKGTDAGLVVQDAEGKPLAVLIAEDGKLHYYPADPKEMQEKLKRLGVIP